ncbi:MAG: saccharopine dehydrogenase NADP-binding domain-containing protein [Thermoanaerobaculia bacterium]|nr:saccharopine dehydrogenase NADP-binding domain-containing protein [Thermoanaerobaculia bacterium]
MEPTGDFLLYGAYGYTGERIAREAANRGQRPILAGRDGERLESLARELDLPWSVFDLEDERTVTEVVKPYPAVLHCAGPFTHTAGPMARACLEAGTHYLDITGEADVFLQMAGRDREARVAAVMLLPGVGFDVVPTDCLASRLSEDLPEAESLELAFRGDSGPSRGTALTMIEHLHEGGLVRRNGELRRVPIAWKTRDVDFGDGPETAVSIPWGDVVTAWYSTEIPNVTVYMAVPRGALRTMKILRWLRPLLHFRLVKDLHGRRVEARPPGPSEERLREGTTRVWGRVEDREGSFREDRLEGPQAYRWTVLTALGAVERVLGGEAPPGFQTPSRAFGSSFVEQLGETRP